MFKNILFIALLTITLSINANAEDKNSHMVFKKSLHSFQFGFSGDISNLKFTEKMIDYKYLLSQNSAIRIGFLINNNSRDLEYEYLTVYTNHPSYGDSTISRVDSYNTNNNEITLELLYLYYISNERKVKGFVGFGPTYSRTKSTNTSIDPYYGSYRNEYTNYSKSKGLSVVFGTEWFMNDYLSLVSEYGISYSKVTIENSDSYRYDVYRNDTRNNNSDNKTLTTQEARFGLAFYF